MPALLPGFEYDVFISYRHKDNKGDQWVTRFVEALKTELESTFKEDISVYFDTNAHDGLNENHDVDLSLKEKVRSLILIPIISQTYCDPKSFAWKNEFLPFLAFASQDAFGLKVKVANGNVAGRVLPVRIRELDERDLALLEKELGGVLRAFDFTFKSAGIHRPLTGNDMPADHASKISYRDQINKVANAIKEILDSLKSGKIYDDLIKNKTARQLGVNQELPVPVSTMFGRSKELEELTALLEKNRVVSIIGSGGMGKTTLALELSHHLRDVFSGNLVFVSMASLTAAEDVIPVLADALGIKDAEGRDLTKGISSHIGDLKAMLVLDNLEQVIDVAPEIALLVSNCPNLKILTTSRTPLKIRAEHEYVLKPLLLPTEQNANSVERLMDFPSVSLFVDRARKVNDTFQVTHENAADLIKICRRLDGLPLALELAAARIRMMSVKLLLQRLEHALDILTSGDKDLPERHQTLRGTIHWSYSLLTEEEKSLFCRMAVFSGGCTMEAMEATCYEEHPVFAYNQLESLVDKGLVHHIGSSDRFMMLETIKEYAQERLAASSETKSVRLRQALYFLKVALEIRKGLENGHQIEAMRRGVIEEGNIQSVLDFLLIEGRTGNAEATEIGLTICGALYFYWHILGKHLTARQYANAFLDLPNCPSASLGKCMCLNTVGLASGTLGKCEQSVKEHQAAYDLGLQLNNKLEMGFSKLSMFISNLGLGKIEEADLCVKEFFKLSLESGSAFQMGFANTALGIMHSVRGEMNEAKVSFEKGLALQRELGDMEGAGLSLGGLALLSSIQGDYHESIELYRAAQDSFVKMGDRAEEARILEEMAWVFLKSGNASDARRSFLESIRAYQDIGSVRGIGIALMGIAGVESAEGHPSKSIQISSAAKLFSEQEGVVNNYGEGFQGKVYLDDTRHKLSDAEWEKAVAAGHKLSLKEALQLASL